MDIFQLLDLLRSMLEVFGDSLVIRWAIHFCLVGHFVLVVLISGKQDGGT